MKKWLLIISGFVVTALLGVIGGLAWARKRVITPPSPEPVKPTNFLKKLQDKKAKINDEINRMDRDDLLDDINNRYD